jgi:hypothetical protein
MKVSLVFVSVLTLVLTGCGAHKNSRPDPSEAAGSRGQLKYEFTSTINGTKCTTGIQVATKTDVLCQALGDETVNGSCATESRKKLFKALGCDPAKYVDIDGFVFGKCPAVHHVNSKQAQCEALKNDVLNANCATTARLNKAKELGCE